MPLLGRQQELDRLRAFLERPGPGVAVVTGPSGVGKTALLSAALEGRDAVHFQGLSLSAGDLLGDLETALQAGLGHLPEARRPGVLPLSTPDARWESLLSGMVDGLEEGGRPMALALDGVEFLLDLHRGMGLRLVEAVRRIQERKVPLKLVVASRHRRALDRLLDPDQGMGPPEEDVELGALSFRVAGWAHGARTPRDAFLRWGLFGDHAAHLPPGLGASGRPDWGIQAARLGEVVMGRVLTPGGDLFDRPLRLMEAGFQRPSRYLAVLRTLAEGPMEWGQVLERTSGITSGGQLAPYLKKLEEEGLVRVDRPLDAAAGSRNRRYGLADPFLAFWCGLVLPYRSLLPTFGPEAVWRERIRPRLGPHLERWLAEAARRWMRDHAEERLPAPSRMVGALWGGEAEFDVVGWLANGQVCYGMARWSDGLTAGEELPREMALRMNATRYGIGREARAALYFLSGGAGEELRRQVARNPLSRVLSVEDLMGRE